jgi:tetratricopeptide (TPR) repeat protein
MNPRMNPRTYRHAHRNLRFSVPLAFVLLIGMSVGLGACQIRGAEESAIQRGDAAFAQGDFTNALAEYRLALQQGNDEASTWLRAGHAFARMNRIDEARVHYDEAIARSPDLTDPAAADLLRVARRALQRNDGVVASAAAEAAARLQPGVSLSGVAISLARHYVRQSQPAEALPYFQKALGEAEDPNDPGIVLELARAYEQLGDCERALLFFRDVRPRVAANRRSEVDWQIGNCSFQLAREANFAGRRDEALELFRTLTDLGEPRNLLGQAWVDVGEILALEGECGAAVVAFERAVQAESGNGALASRARDRIDQIRFRRGGLGPC